MRSEVSSHSAVWASPHFLQFEFFNTSLIGSNSRAFDPHTVLENCIRSVDGHLVICLERSRSKTWFGVESRGKYLVPVFEAEVKVLDVEFKIW